MTEEYKFTIAEKAMANEHGQFFFHVGNTGIQISIYMDSVYIQENDRYNIIYRGMETCYFYASSLSEQAKKFLEQYRNPSSY